jgi:hypothetical protein
VNIEKSIDGIQLADVPDVHQVLKVELQLFVTDGLRLIVDFFRQLEDPEGDHDVLHPATQLLHTNTLTLCSS